MLNLPWLVYIKPRPHVTVPECVRNFSETQPAPFFKPAETVSNISSNTVYGRTKLQKVSETIK